MSGDSVWSGPTGARRSRGFIYLGVLFAIAIAGATLGAIGTVWSTVAQREREEELLFIGHEFRDAIRSYYTAGPTGNLTYPRGLSELLVDNRGPIPVRHLRRIYIDPMTKVRDWELITFGDGAIIGVASRSQKHPFKRAAFDPVDASFEGAGCYCDWQFVYVPSLDGAAVSDP
jgi:type II secretory pathway pseudopilin PulG